MVLESFIIGIGEHADPRDLERLRAGVALHLRHMPGRQGRPARLEVLTREGRPLGWLPEEDARMLETAGAEPAAMETRIAAIIPAFQRPRIQIRVVAPTPDVTDDGPTRPAAAGRTRLRLAVPGA